MWKEGDDNSNHREMMKGRKVRNDRRQFSDGAGNIASAASRAVDAYHMVLKCNSAG